MLGWVFQIIERRKIGPISQISQIGHMKDILKKLPGIEFVFCLCNP